MLNAFYRMFNRRGLPQEMLSDNGKNLVAADKQLLEMTNKMVKDPKLMSQMTSKEIKQNFNPPYVPNFGGVFAILSKADVTDEELMTAFVVKLGEHLHQQLQMRQYVIQRSDGGDYKNLLDIFGIIGYENGYLV